MTKKQQELKIFNNNKKKICKTIPFNTKLTNYRDKYQPPVSKEWKYTIYNYYKNNIKNFSVNNININNTIKSYFNAYFIPKFLNAKFMSKKRRVSILRRIYVSNVELQQNNNKALITLYIINTERKRMIYRYFKKEVLKNIKILLNKYIFYLIKDIDIFTSTKINSKIWNSYLFFLRRVDKGYSNLYWVQGYRNIYWYKKYIKAYKVSKRWSWRVKKKFFTSMKKFIFYLNKLNISKKKTSVINFFHSINNYEFNRFLWFYFFESKKIYLLQLFYKLKFNYLIKDSYQEIKLKSKIKEIKKTFGEWKILILYLEEFLKRNKNLNIKNKNILSTNIFNIQFSKNKKFIYPYKLYIKKLDTTFSILYILNKFLEKFLEKKIEFNIINLKSFVYNSDIFTKSLSLKLKKRKYFSIFKGMHSILKKVKRPKINSIIERKNLKRQLDNSLINNKFKNQNLADNLLLFTNFHQNVQKKFLKSNVIKFLFNQIKYKNMAGLKLEIKGRLTKRYRADKALYRLNWVGGLKNLESSFNRLKSIIYRGYAKPNVTYSFIRSKRRIGAFAVKGWVNGK